MNDLDRFNPRRWQDYGWVLLGVCYYLMVPLIWLAGVLGSGAPHHRGHRRTVRVKSAPSFRMPKPRRIQPPRARRVRPLITTSKRWIKSVGRYQTRYHNTATGRSTYSFRVKDLTGHK